jgi:hypothetical protein
MNAQVNFVALLTGPNGEPARLPVLEVLRNGAQVLERRGLPQRVGYVRAEVVLCHLPDNAHTPFVTWQRNLDDRACYFGHYFQNYTKARADYAKR